MRGIAQGIYEHKCGKESSHYVHGLSNTRLYRIWANMKNRCTNPKCNRANVYSERGIVVCDEWKNNFQAFYDWAMANGYTDELTLDRKNNDKSYSPDNCRWVTYREQALNKRNAKSYEYDGLVFHQCDVFALFGVKRCTFASRLKRGLTVAQALGKG